MHRYVVLDTVQVLLYITSRQLETEGRCLARQYAKEVLRFLEDLHDSAS